MDNCSRKVKCVLLDTIYYLETRLKNRLLIDALPVVNDPSAGSPTETLLRLLLPLDNLVCKYSKVTAIYSRR